MPTSSVKGPALSHYRTTGRPLHQHSLPFVLYHWISFFRVAQKAATFMVSPWGSKSSKSGPFLSQKMVGMIFHIHGDDLNVCGTIAMIVTYSYVCGEIPKFHPLTQCSPESCQFDLCYAQGCLRYSQSVFLEIVCQYFWHPVLTQFPIAWSIDSYFVKNSSWHSSFSSGFFISGNLLLLLSLSWISVLPL